MDQKDLGKVLVVGGSGFIGSHIVEHLLAGKHTTNVVITSRKPKAIDDDRVSYHGVDITSKSSINHLFDVVKPQVVFHTVSPLPRVQSSELRATNVLGTQNLLEAAKACAATKVFVYTSSDSACHWSFTEITEEECRLRDERISNNMYGSTKAIADASVLAANSLELKTATIRVSLVYGERDHGFIPMTVKSIRKGEHRNQVGPNDKIWEYAYAGNAAHGHILAAHALSSNTPGADGQAYFITDGVRMPFFDFYRKCCAAAGHPVSEKDVKVIPLWVVQTIASVAEWLFWIFTAGNKTPPMRRDDMDHIGYAGCFWSIEKARRLLGYEPWVNQDEAIRRSMKWGLDNC